MSEKQKDGWDKALITAQILACAAIPFIILAVTQTMNFQFKERETSIQELAQAIAVLQSQSDEQQKKELRAWADTIFKRKVAATKSNDGSLNDEWVKVAAMQDVIRQNAEKLCRRPPEVLMKKAEPIVEIPDTATLDAGRLLMEHRLQYKRLALHHDALITTLELSCGYLQKAFEEAEK